jgi:uncharacterized protein YwqG
MRKIAALVGLAGIIGNTGCSPAKNRSPANAIFVAVDARPLPDFTPYPSSYFGGLPHMPEGLQWPMYQDREGWPAREQTFIAQIDLADLPVIAGSDLPERGKLLFFSYTGFSGLPTDRNDWARIIYVPDGETHLRQWPPTLWDMEATYERPWIKPGTPEAGIAARHGVRFAPMTSSVEAYGSMTDDDASVTQAYLHDQFEDTRQEAAIPTQARPALGGPLTRNTVFLAARSYVNLISRALEYEMPPADENLELARFIEERTSTYLAEMEEFQRIMGDLTPAGLWERPDTVEVSEFIATAEAFIARYEMMADRFAVLELSGEVRAKAMWIVPPLKTSMRDPGRLMDEIEPWTMMRAVEAGAEVDELYPAWAIDHHIPENGVVQPGEQTEIMFNFPDKMMGIPDVVQHAGREHSDKVLLLELHGRSQYTWHGPIDCVLQYWITHDALAERDFGQAFATLECT